MTLSRIRLVGVAPRPGFTLLEVLAVVAIMVVLIGVGGMVYFRYVDESKEGAAMMGVRSIEFAVDAYKMTHGEYPPNLEVLTQPEDGKPAVLEIRHLMDPWQRPYIYEPGSTHHSTGKPRIYSQGMRPGDANAIKANW